MFSGVLQRFGGYLNTDEVVKREMFKARCGGLIRDDRGRWLCGFARSLGSCHSAYIAKLWDV